MIWTGERRRRLHSDSITWLPYSRRSKLLHILHFIIILSSSTVSLYSRVSSTICQTVVHDLSTLPLILNAAYLVMRSNASAVLIVHLIIILSTRDPCRVESR